MTRRANVILFSLIAGALVVFALLRQPRPPAIILPSPNGFDDFLRAGSSISGTAEQIRRLADTNALQEFVSENTEALALVRQGLSRESRVVIDCTLPMNVAVNANLQQVWSLKKLVPLLLAEGRLAAAEGRIDAGLGSYLEALRFSHESVRGGVMLHRITALSMEGIALLEVRAMMHELGAAECRHAIQILALLETNCEPMTATIEQERQWAFQTSDWSGKVLLRLFRRALRQTEMQVTKNFTSRQLKARELMIELAARAYEMEHGKRPKTVAQLVPAYLALVPKHPETQQDLTLRR